MSPPVETETHFMTRGAVSEKLSGTVNGAHVSFETAAEAGTIPAPDPHPEAEDNSLFERFAWLYVFFRERLFRDDTDRIIQALWAEGSPPAGTRLIELGCGPGFYSCRLAARFPSISVQGVDRSPRQLDCAQEKAHGRGLDNCLFESDDVLNLSHADASFDVLLAARLFTILPDQKRAIAEKHRVLRPGGRCLIAEPRYALWASLPLLTMWFLAGLTHRRDGFCEPGKAIVLSAEAFKNLFASQPWRSVKTWRVGRYQYALCEKV
ncbi:MAG: class I SAM-dependent methyltransferase [Acidobacteria bacterium]|nr:class I SAM-dependent methyltransferase [Acidobacteriota bacterium]